MPPISEQSGDNFDKLLSARLRQLDAQPVDTTTLDRALRDICPAPSRRKPRWLPRVVALAAGLILTASVATVLLLSPGEVMASPSEIAAMHLQMVAGDVQAMKAENLTEVNRALHAQWGDFPGIPQMTPGAGVHMHDCCIQKMKDARMAFVMLDVDGKLVSMAVAKAKDVASPKAAVIKRGNSSFTVQTVGNLNMVMTEQGPRWICLTGDVPAEKLMDIATQFVKD